MKSFNKLISAASILCSVLLLSSCSLTELFGKAGINKNESSTTENSTDTLNASIDIDAYPELDFSTVDLDQYMTLDYKGVKLESSYSKREITDEIVDYELNYIMVQSKNYTLNSNTSLKTAQGQYIEMDYEGFMDGEAFTGGTSSGALIYLDEDESGFIPGFAAGLIGCDVGSTVTLDLVFPDNYYTDLAGKDVQFKVKINGICECTLTDAIASSLSDGQYTTVDAYLAHFREYLLELEDRQVLNAVYSSIPTALDELAVIKSYPKTQVDYYYYSLVQQVIEYANASGISYDKYLERLGYTDSDLKTMAETSTKSDMIINYIAKKESIELTEEAYKEFLQSYVDYYNEMGYTYTAEQIESGLGKDTIMNQCFKEKVYMAVYDYAEITYVAE